MSIDTFLLFLILCMANYRLAMMWATEEGPFELCQKWRNLFIKDGWLGRGVRCPYCTGFWTGALLALFIWPHFIPVWFGLSGAVLLLDKWWKR